MGKTKTDKARDIDGSAEGKEQKKHRALMIVTIILGVAIVAVLIGIYVIFYRFAYNAERLAEKSAKVYAYGSGENMATLIAPGYIEHFEGKSEVLSISDIQDIYISQFQTYVEERIGEIKDVKCDIGEIQALSNVEDLRQGFADNGVSGVSQYRSVTADWILTGDNGDELTIPVSVYVLKCDDGWYIDYVKLPDDISGTTLDIDKGDKSDKTEESSTADTDEEDVDGAA